MSVKLGIAPIAWSNDDMPELGGDTPLEQCLSEASQAGFIGIESGGKFPKTSEELLPKLNEFKLNFSNRNLTIPGFLGNFPPSSTPMNPAEFASCRHCSIGVSPPSSGMSSLLQAIGAIPNFTDIKNIFVMIY